MGLQRAFERTKLNRAVDVCRKARSSDGESAVAEGTASRRLNDQIGCGSGTQSATSCDSRDSTGGLL